MILDLDVGNSRIKWRLTATGQPTMGVVANLAELAGILAGTKPDRIRAACVRPQFVTALEQWGRSQFRVEPELARVQRRWAGLEIFYEEPERLGVDRWLAMLAAWQQAAGSCMVVDCGTALTVDLVGEGGQHRGGYIVPGLNLCTRTLVENTAIRLGPFPKQVSLSPGHSTDQAVYQGVVSMLVALIMFHDGRAVQEAGQIYLTGGDGKLFADLLLERGIDVRIVDGLVLDGLAVALP